MRLIDADKLQIAIVEKGQADERHKYKIGEFWELNGAEIRETINKMPTINPPQGYRVLPDGSGWEYYGRPEISLGRWLRGKEISRDYIGDACVAIHYEKWWCSKCNYPVDSKPLWNYCPNCGAKMESE